MQADDGYLYPLERAFFYVQKPPTLLVHDEIESVEFLRQGGGMLAASAKTFDLSIRMQADQVRRLCKQLVHSLCKQLVHSWFLLCCAHVSAYIGASGMHCVQPDLGNRVYGQQPCT